MKNKIILGITAHPDDHVMFAGTVMKLQEQGYQYYEVVLTTGSEGGNYKDKKQKNRSQIEKIRDFELQKAQKFLHIKEIFRMKEEDQNLMYSKDLMYKLVNIIRKIKPAIGFAINQKDTHPDHRASSVLAAEAFRWAAKSVRLDLGPVHRVDVALFAEGTLPIKPALLVDITKYYEKKENLFKQYVSQASSRDLDLLKSFAHIRGFHLRKSKSIYAEAFTVDQNILPILFE